MKIFIFFVVLFACVLTQNDLPKFPPNFLFGTATSSYQIEGAYNVDGRTFSIWDTFSRLPNKTINGDTGDVACDSYNKFKQDIQLMKDMGIKFSISWSRLLPSGRLPANPKGVEFYNNLINELLNADIIPFITLFHWDFPQSLQSEYLGFLNSTVVQDFANYADFCFKTFGDRVKNWITHNEPWVYTYLGHYNGEHAPGRCSNRNICAEGDGNTEPYIVAHNLILSHGKAVQVYRQNYQRTQGGEIGITLNCDWKEPFSNNANDIDAAQRSMEFQNAWFFDPIYFGDYPDSMKRIVGARLPVFTDEQKRMIKGSSDFFGINHYTSRYAKYGVSTNPGYDKDTQAMDSILNDKGEQIGIVASPPWLYVVPWGFRKILNWISRRYSYPMIYVTENGVGERETGRMNLNDTVRVNYYSEYLKNLFLSIQDGSRVRGYMAWSLLDNFEWAYGYTERFGIHYIDFKDNQKRYKKQSALWWKDFLQNQEQSFLEKFGLMVVTVVLIGVSFLLIGVMIVIFILGSWISRKNRNSYDELK